MESPTKNRTNVSVAKGLLTKLILRLIKVPPAFLSECEFRPVNTKEEFIACSKLVHQEYVRKDYMIPHPNKLRLDVRQMTAKSTTFIALYKRRYILATLTLVEDSPFGVPMDKIYKDELDEMRHQKTTFGEVTMLATNTALLQHPETDFKSSDQMIVLLYLFRELFSHVRNALCLSSLVACFHPRHEMFYQAIKFAPLGSLKPYGSVHDNPAVAYRLNVADLDQLSGGLEKYMSAQASGPRVGAPYCRFNFDEFLQIFTNLDSAA